MSTNQKKYILDTVSVSLGGPNCPPFSTPSRGTTATAGKPPTSPLPPQASSGQEPPGRPGVEKESDDPYLDFRQSMILENEIYVKDELFSCFLQLNAPYYEGTIVRAFTEIWNGVYWGRRTCMASRDF